MNDDTTGNQRFTPAGQAINMADRGESSNAHAVHKTDGGPYLRTILTRIPATIWTTWQTFEVITC
jgi:hypothetical protein